MSYILDALRKADAQRERDASRGIHAHPATLGTGPGSSAAAPRLWMWGVLGTGIALVAIAGWYFTRSPQPGAPAVTASVSAPPPAAANLPPAAPVAMQPPIVPSPLPAPAESISPPPAPRERPNVAAPPMRGLPQTNVVPESGPGISESQRAAMAREQAFAARAAQQSAPPAAPAVAPAPAPSQPSAVAQANPAPAAPAPAATSGLPPDAPKFSISGGVYSPSPAQRMLIVNGQVFNEGSEIAPGVTVEQIQSRTAILRFRGMRYTVAY